MRFSKNLEMQQSTTLLVQTPRKLFKSGAVTSVIRARRAKNSKGRESSRMGTSPPVQVTLHKGSSADTICHACFATVQFFVYLCHAFLPSQNFPILILFRRATSRLAIYLLQNHTLWFTWLMFMIPMMKHVP